MTEFNLPGDVITTPATPGTQAIVHHPHEEGAERWHVRPVVAWEFYPRSGRVFPLLWSLSKEATDAVIVAVLFSDGSYQVSDSATEIEDGSELWNHLRRLGADFQQFPYNR